MSYRKDIMNTQQYMNQICVLEFPKFKKGLCKQFISSYQETEGFFVITRD